jgi:hypothetical protein
MTTASRKIALAIPTPKQLQVWLPFAAKSGLRSNDLAGARLASSRADARIAARDRAERILLCHRGGKLEPVQSVQGPRCLRLEDSC